MHSMLFCHHIAFDFAHGHCEVLQILIHPDLRLTLDKAHAENQCNVMAKKHGAHGTDAVEFIIQCLHRFSFSFIYSKFHYI